MKTQIELPSEEQPKVPKFPLLAKSADPSSKVVVEFLSEETGVERISGTGIPCAEYYGAIKSCFKTHHWTILPPGTRLILTQE